ncbi:MAG: SPOR domain-containing protein [Candidatus Omnitrophota bacterium]
MNINYRHTQFELFPHAQGQTPKDSKRPYFFSNLRLSLENVVIGGIFILMTMILSFSLGVEKGKKIVYQPHLSPQTATEESVSQTEVILPEPTERVKASSDQQDASEQEPMILAQLKEESPKSNPQNSYTIQVASFQKEEYAQKEASRLKKDGFSHYEIFVLPKGKFSIVCVGSFSQRNDAQENLSQLKRKYKDCLVRRL